jgi:hypothetical protein
VRVTCQIDLCADGPSVTHEKHTRDKFGVRMNLSLLSLIRQLTIAHRPSPSHTRDCLRHLSHTIKLC